jgi:polysaccharide export outer membrane protein
MRDDRNRMILARPAIFTFNWRSFMLATMKNGVLRRGILLCLMMFGLALTGAKAADGVMANAQPVKPITAADQSDFILGPSDRLRIMFYGEEALNGQPEYMVSANGMVSLPLVGEVKAAGLTVTQFQGLLLTSYRKGYLDDPKISVQILSARPFYILGEVKTPGQYPYTPGLTVYNAVATAGGFTYRARKGTVYIRHAGEDDEKSYDLKANTPVAPGDTVRIDERWF